MSQRVIKVSGILVGGVWVFHGLYSKLCNGFPRHREIVARVVGEELATPVTRLVGAGEVLLGLWTWSGRAHKACATTQTAALVSMNALEISRAKDLLISAPGMLILNGVLMDNLALGVFQRSRLEDLKEEDVRWTSLYRPRDISAGEARDIRPSLMAR